MLREALLVSNSPSSSSSPSSLSLLDLNSLSTLISFKQAVSASSHSTGFVGAKDGLGGLVFSVQKDKAVLNVWNWQRDQLHLRIILPQKLASLSCSPSGKWIAGGSEDGRIYVWETSTGTLLSSHDAHYRAVNVLKWTDDDAALVSGSEDSGVSVWATGSLLSPAQKGSFTLPVPYASFSDHTLPITDLAIGLGKFPRGRIWTASADGSVKLWDLATRSLLTTFMFPSPIDRIALDPTERLFFAASSASPIPTSSSARPSSSQGRVYRVDMFRRRKEGAVHSSMVDTLTGLRSGDSFEAVGGGGPGEVQRWEADESRRLIEVPDAVQSMALSLSASHLIIGTTTEVLHIFDVPSSQLLRTYALTASAQAAMSAPAAQAPRPGATSNLGVTSLATMLRPPDLMGHLELGVAGRGGGGGGRGLETMPVRPIAPFARTVGRLEEVVVRVGDGEDVTAILNPLSPFSYPAPVSESSPPSALLAIRPTLSSATTATTANDESRTSQHLQLSDLQSEVARLREQLSQATAVNDEMWKAIVEGSLPGIRLSKDS